MVGEEVEEEVVGTAAELTVRFVTFSRAALEACCHRRSVGSGARLHTGRKPSLIGGPFFAAEQPHVSASKMRRHTDVYFQRCAWTRGVVVKWWWRWWWQWWWWWWRWWWQGGALTAARAWIADSNVTYATVVPSGPSKSSDSPTASWVSTSAWRTRKIISDWTRSLICLLSESFERFCLITRAAVSLIASVFDLIFCAWVTRVGTAVYL